MKKMNFNTRAYVTKNGQLMIRVRWNSKKNEVAFSVGYTIDPMKWDSTKQLVKANTTHYIISSNIRLSEFFRRKNKKKNEKENHFFVLLLTQ